MFSSEQSNASGWSSTFQWKLNGNPLTGQTNSTFSSSSLNNGDRVSVDVTFTCSDNTELISSNQLQVTIYETPTVSEIDDIILCNTENSEDVTFLGNADSFIWNSSNNDIGLSSSGNGNIPSFKAKNTGYSPITSVITVTPYIKECQGETKSFSITVNPTPTVERPENIGICNGEVVDAINFSGNQTSNIQYFWTNSATSIGLPNQGTGTINSFTATNTGNNPVTANLTVTPVANDCQGEARSFSITVYPTPEVDQPEDIVVCNQETVSGINFTDNAVAGNLFYWSSSNTNIGIPSQGMGNIDSFQAINPGNSAITATITVTPKANDCAGESKTFTITVNPTPTVSDLDDLTVCNGEQIEKFEFSGSSVAGTTYKWTNDNPNIGLSQEGTNAIPQFKAINNGSDPITAAIEVTPLANGCEGEPRNFTITVNPTPFINTPADQTICEDNSTQPINFSGNTVSNTQVSWTNDHPEIGLPASGTGNISSFTGLNPTNKTIQATITIIPSANSCQGSASSFIINVKPKPELAAPDDQTLCSGVKTETLPLGLIPGNTTFSITGGSSIGLADRSNQNEIPSFTPINNSATPISKSISLIPVSEGCQGDTVTFTITVNPAPSITISNANPTICSGSNTAIIISSPVSNAKFSWEIQQVTPANSVIGASEGSGNEIRQSLTNQSGSQAKITYLIYSEADSCRINPVPVTVTVNPVPNLKITEPETVCAPASIDLTSNEITAGSDSNLNFSYWTNSNLTNPVSDPSKVSAGTYYIKATNEFGCEISEKVTITEFPLPELTSESNVAGFCSETPFIYEFNSSIVGTTFNWSRPQIDGISTPANSDEGDIDEVLVNTTNHPITVKYEVTLISPEGCLNSASVTTTVTPTPILTSDLSPGSICSGSPFSYSPSSSVNGTNFKWTRQQVAGISNPAASGTGNISETLENTTNQTLAVTYQYQLSSNNCTNPQTYSITVPVTPSPQTEVYASQNGEEKVSETIEICQGGSIDLFSETAIPNNSGLPTEILNANFNNSSNSWTTSGNGQRNWNRVNNGEVVDTQCGYVYVGPNWWNYEYRCEDIELHSNDNSSFFLVNSNATNGRFNTVTLTSPVFSTSGYNSLSLSFWHYYRDGGSRRNDPLDIGRLEYRIGNGNWRSLNNINFTSTEGGPDSFVQRTIDISSLVGNNQVQIRFNYDDANGDYYWAVDNIIIGGDGSSQPEVTWTTNNSDWTSNQQNPEDVSPPISTIYTATYVDPDTGCPGSKSIEVVVKDPPQPVIKADYCAYPNEPNKIRLYVEGSYDRYEWTSSGETISTQSSIDVTSAQGYTLRVWENGCEGSSSIDISENLIENGDFEAGNTGFSTQYNYQTDRAGRQDELVPEGTYAIAPHSNPYHYSFNDSGDHTTGDGNFMIVNGDPNLGNVVWETNGFLEVKPNTDYYFGAWTTNLVSRSEADKYARLRLQIIVRNGNGQQVAAESTLGDLRFQNVGEWIEFYNSQVWNSGDYEEVKLRIINENTIRDGNDFGIDDISFAEINAVEFTFDPQNNGPICQEGTIQLSANLEGGRDPITYQWTGPNGFSSSEANPVIENATTDNSGDYQLSITDFYGCSNAVKTTTVEVIPETIVDAGEDQEVCAEMRSVDLTGSISGSVTSGTWSGPNGSFEPSPNSLDVSYSFSEEDIQMGFVDLVLTSDAPQSPCEVSTDTVRIIINPTPIIEELVIANNECNAGSSGSATASVISGTAPYTYNWSDGQTGETATDLVAGDYELVVTDALGCSTSQAFTIQDPSPLQLITLTSENISCYDASDGIISLEVSGGNLPEDPVVYTVKILKENGATLADQSNADGYFEISDLPAGAFTVLVSTENECSVISRNITLIQPAEIVVSAGEDINPDECGVSSVQLKALPVDPNLGSGQWSIVSGEGGSFEVTGDPYTQFSGIAGETYELEWQVTPANGCAPISDQLIVTLTSGCSKLDFDGENDYVTMGDHYALDQNFTIEVWVKPNGIQGIQTILSKRNAANINEGGYDLILNNGKPEFRYNSRSVTSPFKLDTNRWYHLSITGDDSEVTLFIDGIKIQSFNSENIISQSAPFLLGAMFQADQPAKPVNYYHGWIQELRIWNKALTQDQLHFMMNQKILNNNGAVRGEIIPINIPGNISWSDLQAYYQLDIDELTNGATPDVSSNPIPGLLRNIETLQENTAPLPYMLYNTSAGEWYDQNSWELPSSLDGRTITQRNVWDPPNSNGVKPSVKIDWNIVILKNNIKNEGTPNDKNHIKLLGLLSESGTFQMNGENNFSGNALEISNYLLLNGYIDFNGESQLLQPEGSIIDIQSSGYIDRDQQGTKNSFNYNYWTSPVSSIGNKSNQGFDIYHVLKDGDANDRAISFNNQYHYADYNYSGNLRLSTYWMYVFHGGGNNYSEWHGIDQNTHLKTGEGYTMKGTHGFANIRDIQNYTFRGMPNNGDISLNISKGENRLLGNPYPSAIDATEFIRDNIKDVSGGRNSKNVFNGSLYFWDHFGQQNTHILAEYVGGYAVLNLSGGIPGVSNDTRINNNGQAGSKSPNRFIPVGQGFFVNATIDENSNYNFGIDGGLLTFKNNQRVYARENPGNSQFLAPEQNNKLGIQTKKNTSDVRQKIRLKFESPKGYHRQILATADLNASKDFDLGYDAPLIENNKEDMYWLIENSKYVIQGVSDFEPEIKLPIGVRIAENKDFSIRIDSLENWRAYKEILLEDTKLDSVHNLRDGEYISKDSIGEVNDRFAIIFKYPNLEENEDPLPQLDSRLDIGYYNDPDILQLKNPEQLAIYEILIYDLTGKLLKRYQDITPNKEVNIKMEDVPIGTYIIKLYSENGELNKKFLVKK
ncbi:PKD-like domain-containing protein [Christiangramia flava]|uniref:PKD-like domain-containing protein n=1 Tax=Christiangramia flava TaxID=1486245 RepID=UPI001302B996|nr:PKD-like domain-containing protein [Christiangramia flava]